MGISDGAFPDGSVAVAVASGARLYLAKAKAGDWGPRQTAAQRQQTSIEPKCGRRASRRLSGDGETQAVPTTLTEGNHVLFRLVDLLICANDREPRL